MNLRAADPEGQPWVERGGPGVLVRMAAVGAKGSLLRRRALEVCSSPRAVGDIAALRLSGNGLPLPDQRVTLAARHDLNSPA
jgi:hypothetical protein